MSKEEKLLDYRRKVVPTKEGQWTSATGEGNAEHMQGKYMLPGKEDIIVQHQTFVGRDGK